MRWSLLLLQLALALLFPNTILRNVSAQEADQVAADQRKVAVLMRLTTIDVNEKPKLKTVVVRFLKTVTDEAEYLNYAKRFPISETVDRLWEIGSQSMNDNNRVRAIELMLGRASSDEVKARLLKLENPEPLIDAMGLVGSKPSIELLNALVTGTKLSASAKNSAVKGMGRQVLGQEILLELVKTKKLPEECEFAVANILHSSTDEKIKQFAMAKLKLPATAGSKPLSPMSELVRRKGDLQNGKAVFVKQGTCANCHLVGGQGKEVGPDLSEIGSKLSRQAMFESILNPSLAVSHNFETYLIQTFDGLSFSGILISETDDKVVLRTAEAVTKEISKEDIEGMKKSKQSLMPKDLQKNFTESDLVDLVEYLMTLKKK